MNGKMQFRVGKNAFNADTPAEEAMPFKVAQGRVEFEIETRD